VDFIRMFILGNSEAGSPERIRMLDIAKKNLGYAGFLFKNNRGLATFYQTSKNSLGTLLEIESD